MASAFTPNKKLEKPANGDDVDTWDVPVNADWDRIDLAFGGLTTLNVVAASGTIALTALQYSAPFIVLSGLLTANVNYQVPTTVGGFWWVFNNTTGAFTVTLSSGGGGTSILIPQTSRIQAICDGTNVVFGSAAAGANTDITSLSGLGITGVVKGTGASAPLVAATAGTDYVARATPTNFIATQTFSGSSSVLAGVLANIAEVATISATAATGTILIYPATQSILYYTSNAAANWTVNITLSAGTTLDTAMTTGQALTVAFLVTQGGTAFYNTVVQVDGTTTGITTKWQGGAPVSGNINGVDVYTYTVIKTGAGTFTVLATQTLFL